MYTLALPPFQTFLQNFFCLLSPSLICMLSGPPWAANELALRLVETGPFLLLNCVLPWWEHLSLTFHSFIHPFIDFSLVKRISQQEKTKLFAVASPAAEFNQDQGKGPGNVPLHQIVFYYTTDIDSP